ncbi:putative leucine-rich repeat protein [Leishmania major strain Friedlin]|uniref:Putative leucine-rich repeat protein n=1 Tax=Leishmania major TaxID=5664 RepID=Q4QHK2_LEIMA|nr:putative leucine-rich repeat protein [Leishmania major strain Friedlin]CAG9569990.1 leucine-rich_repeat_protein_-_putative [Leishmania major strain Friedlin]CAJ02399.1 putative leucine-rich repeat protein [Leishmania major strain Friedlin]|eukprot:XP_001681346.1 putative leucine-rich repeat protein [Leishmania major strain Friedlin]
MALVHTTYPQCLSLVEADTAEAEVQQALEDGANTLYFSHHFNYTDVPPSIAALREQLEVLHIDNNYPFTTISPRVTALTNLRWLNASYCSLRSVDSSISRLSKLERLTLNNNMLTWLPLDVWQLKALEELHIDNNQLNVLPGCLLFLPRLRVLTLENNPLYTHEEVNGAAAATYIPVQCSVDCSACCIRSRNYKVFVTFHTIVGHSDVPFVHVVCSDECAVHVRSRLEAYDRAHANQP